MPNVLITGAARANSIAAGISSRLRIDGWNVFTSDLTSTDYTYDLSDPEAPEETHHPSVSAENGPIEGFDS